MSTDQAGRLNAPDVEKLVRDEVKKREDVASQRLTDGRAKTKSGESPAAIDAFKAVWEDGCLFPKKAKDAAKELKKLGVAVDEKRDRRRPRRGADLRRPEGATGRGRHAARSRRRAGRPLRAGCGALRRAPRAIDPGDPTPARYLGELYRHHTGEWAKAREVFEEILRIRRDPLSRAVALHGLGKMTIHEGAFAKGLSLLEESVAAVPAAPRLPEPRRLLELGGRRREDGGLREEGAESRSRGSLQPGFRRRLHRRERPCRRGPARRPGQRVAAARVVQPGGDLRPDRRPGPGARAPEAPLLTNTSATRRCAGRR